MTAPGETSITWTGANGDVIDLRDTAGGIFLGEKAVGLHTPPVDAHVTELHGVPGQFWRGQQVKARTVILEVHVRGGDEAEWTVRDQRLWAGLDPSKTGKLTITKPNGLARFLECRPVWDDDHDYKNDPRALNRHVVYAVELTADNPMWRGAAAPQNVTALTRLAWHPTPTHMAGWVSSGTGTATLNNPGDAPTYPEWKLAGPINQAVTLTAAGKTIYFPSLVVAEGTHVTVRVDPGSAGVFAADGTRLPNTATSFPMDPLPAGDFVVTVSVGLRGTATLTYSPQFWRPW